VLGRAEGFAHGSRDVTGLLLRPKKPLQGSSPGQVWEPDTPRSRRARHEAVFEAGREVISLDWTYAQHARGRKMWAVPNAWDHVEPRLASEQTVVTAVVAHRGRRAGIEVVVQQPDRHEAEMAYWQETGPARSTPLATARGRLWARLH
jgi:hypothetical protein